MAVVATITIGANTYSAYGITADPVADALEYFAAQFGETWSALTTLQQQQAIISATRLGDRALLYSGAKTVAAQALKWPRDGATNGCTGVAVTNGTIPDDIAHGTFELADAIAKDPDLLTSASEGTNVKGVKAGSAAVDFFGPTIGTSEETRLPQNAHDLLACYIEGAGGITPTGGTLASGTGDSSEFEDRECDWDRTRGY